MGFVALITPSDHGYSVTFVGHDSEQLLVHGPCRRLLFPTAEKGAFERQHQEVWDLRNRCDHAYMWPCVCARLLSVGCLPVVELAAEVAHFECHSTQRVALEAIARGNAPASAARR